MFEQSFGNARIFCIISSLLILSFFVLQNDSKPTKKPNSTSGGPRQTRRTRCCPPSSTPSVTFRGPPLIEPSEASPTSIGIPTFQPDQLHGAKSSTPSQNRKRTGRGQQGSDDGHRQGATPLRRVDSRSLDRLRRLEQRRGVLCLPRRGHGPRAEPRLLLLGRPELRDGRTRFRRVHPGVGRHQVVVPDRAEGVGQPGVVSDA